MLVSRPWKVWAQRQRAAEVVQASVGTFGANSRLSEHTVFKHEAANMLNHHLVSDGKMSAFANSRICCADPTECPALTAQETLVAHAIFLSNGMPSSPHCLCLLHDAREQSALCGGMACQKNLISCQSVRLPQVLVCVCVCQSHDSLPVVLQAPLLYRSNTLDQTLA